MAVSKAADVIIFPELSITGYEPALSKQLAIHQNDNRFDVFQELSDNNQVTIGVGAPVRNSAGISISMLLFQPLQPRSIYSKKYLHSDEEPYFVSGQNTTKLLGDTGIALAICYELSVPEHSQNASKNGAEVYIASVAKSSDGVDKAMKILSGIASKYSMTVLMSNCIGYSDNFESGGRSCILDNNGKLLAELNETDEGLLILDTNTQEVIEEKI